MPGVQAGRNDGRVEFKTLTRPPSLRGSMLRDKMGVHFEHRAVFPKISKSAQIAISDRFTTGEVTCFEKNNDHWFP